VICAYYAQAQWPSHHMVACTPGEEMQAVTLRCASETTGSLPATCARGPPFRTAGLI
jgi:hypothetical protein